MPGVHNQFHQSAGAVEFLKYDVFLMVFLLLENFTFHLAPW
jgi:hypothetical protein